MGCLPVSKVLFLNKGDESGRMEYHLSVKEYLLASLTNGRMEQVLKDSGCLRGEQVSLLSEVLDQNMENQAAIEELLYQYGHLLKRTDYLGRQIFVCMVVLLRVQGKHESEIKSE